MTSHNVHYFDSRYVEPDDVGTNQASDIIDEVSQADDVLHIGTNHSTSLDELNDGDYVIIEDPITRTPLNYFNYVLQSYRDLIDIEEELGGQEGEMILEQIEEAGEYFRAGMPSNHDGNFIFKLAQDSTFHDISEYTDDHRDHSIFGIVKHVYQRNEKDHYLDIMNDVPGKSRKERREQRMRLKEMANELDSFLDENVSESDFYISHPDITLTPIAVYD